MLAAVAKACRFVADSLIGEAPQCGVLDDLTPMKHERAVTVSPSRVRRVKRSNPCATAGYWIAGDASVSVSTSIQASAPKLMSMRVTAPAFTLKGEDATSSALGTPRSSSKLALRT